jgi:hypothetical protein
MTSNEKVYYLDSTIIRRGKVMKERHMRIHHMIFLMLLIGEILLIHADACAQNVTNSTILKKEDVPSFHLITDESWIKKNQNKYYSYYEAWSSLGKREFWGKTDMNNKADYYVLGISITTFPDNKSASEPINQYLQYYGTEQGHGHWEEGSYTGKVYGDRTICLKKGEGLLEGSFFALKIQKGNKSIQITASGELKGKGLSVDFVEGIAEKVLKKI